MKAFAILVCLLVAVVQAAERVNFYNIPGKNGVQSWYAGQTYQAVICWERDVRFDPENWLLQLSRLTTVKTWSVGQNFKPYDESEFTGKYDALGPVNIFQNLKKYFNSADKNGHERCYIADVKLPDNLPTSAYYKLTLMRKPVSWIPYKVNYGFTSRFTIQRRVQNQDGTYAIQKAPILDRSMLGTQNFFRKCVGGICYACSKTKDFCVKLGEKCKIGSKKCANTVAENTKKATESAKDTVAKTGNTLADAAEATKDFIIAADDLAHGKTKRIGTEQVGGNGVMTAAGVVDPTMPGLEVVEPNRKEGDVASQYQYSTLRITDPPGNGALAGQPASL